MGVMVCALISINEVALHLAPVATRMSDVTVCRQINNLCNQPPKSTQPSIPPGLWNRAPACIAGVIRRVHLRWVAGYTNVIWQVTSRIALNWSSIKSHKLFNHQRYYLSQRQFGLVVSRSSRAVVFLRSSSVSTWMDVMSLYFEIITSN